MNINENILRLIAEMQDLGKTEYTRKNLVLYNKMREDLLNIFLDEFNGGYRLKKEV